jgi:hypothetical protein
MNFPKMASLMMRITALFSLATFPAYGSDFSLSSSSGIWTGTNGGSDINGIGTNEVRWGIGASADTQSGLRFEGIGNLDFDIDQTINLGTLTHFNNPVSSAASGATLELGLEFSTPSLSDSFTFAFDIDETTNSEPCSYPSDPGNPCSDRISFPASFPTESFSFDGADYTVELLGFGSNAGNITSGFISQEGGSNTNDLFAQITLDPTSTPEPEPEPEPEPNPGNPAKTPEPMTFGGLGLVGLYVIRRRLQK